MQLNNIAMLTSFALLSTANAYDVSVWDAGAGALAQIDNLLDDKNLADVINQFQQHAEWPLRGPLNTVLGFKKVRGLFTGIQQVHPEHVVAFASTSNRSIMKKLSKASIAAIVDTYTEPPAAGPALTALETACNDAVTIILENSDPKNWPNDMSIKLIDSLKDVRASVAQLRKINPVLLKNKPAPILGLIQSNVKHLPVLVTKSILSVLLKHDVACETLSPEAFKYIARNQEAAKCINGRSFVAMDKVHADGTCARFVRFLPNNIFEYIVAPFRHSEFVRYATPDQIKNWQAKTIKITNAHIPVVELNRHQCAVLPVKVYMKYFEQAKTDPNIVQDLETWTFWKHLPTKVLKELLDETNIATLIPAEGFKQMTVAQRQLILDAGDKDKGTDCSMLPRTILKGKKKRVTGLTASKKCFESLGDNGSWIFRALVLDMFDGKLGRKLSAAAVAQFSTKLRRAKKANDDGKLTSRPDLELDGVLALEALQHKKKGPEFVKAFFDHKDKDVLETVCKIEGRDLRRTKWLQTMMTKACVKHIDFDLDDAKRLHPNIWVNMGKEQIKKLIGDRSDLKELDGPFMEGLAANKHFAARSCKKRTKENKEGDDVDRKPELALVKPSVRSKYFGSKYIKALPDDKDCMATVAAHVASLADDAMAGVTAAWVSKNKNVVENLRPEQFGRISDDLDAETYPASMNAANIMGLSNDQVSNLSAKFLSHMTPSGLSYFSAEQVKLIPADSLTLLCGDKAKAIKHELSESQKAALGKDCPATEGSMAPTNAHIGAFTAAAALAAGSLALLI